jgi:APA family basic amino acid/polyamine antiporter
MPTAASPAQATSTRGIASGLLPTLGLFTTIMMVVGGVIGSGIFKKPAVMAAQLGSPQLVLGVWLVAGVITLFGALTNAEIASMIPETGGQYVYFDRMYGPFAAFLFGWAVFAVIQTGSIAALAFVFAEYAAQFLTLPEFSNSVAGWSVHIWGIGDVAPLKDIGTKAVAASLITFLTVVNYLGVKFGGLVQNVFTVAKVTVMLLLMAGAFLLPTGGSASHLTTASSVIHPQGLALALALAAALQGAFWAYDGWNTITFISGEVKQPQRNIPRGVIIGMFMVTALYLLMNFAYSYVLPIDVMAKSKLVAADVAEKCFSGGGRWIALGVMISTFGACNATTLASARVYFSMARRNVFPQFIGRAHPRFHTPGASLVVQGVWSVLLLFSGTFDTVTDMLIFVSWIFYAAGAFGIFVLRRNEPAAPRPYKVPGYPFIPWIFVLFAITYLVFTVYKDISGAQEAIAAGKSWRIDSALGTVLVLIGAPLYFVFRARNALGEIPNSRH